MPFSADDEPIDIALRGLHLHERNRTSALLGGFVDERYEIRGILGAGASGIVYSAYDAQIGRPVALKILRPDLVTNPVAAERLRREARVLGGLRHENVVAIHDLGRCGDRPFIVMELVEGKTLAELFAARSLDLESKIEIVAAAARGVAAVHAHGIVHRDLKPSNILVGDDGRVRVADFGHSTWCDRPSDLTLDGARLGTPAYMAPECLKGRSADFQSDVFSLGAVLHEAAVGYSPHIRDSGFEEGLERGSTEVRKGSADPVRSPMSDSGPTAPLTAERLQALRSSGEPTKPSTENSTVSSDLDLVILRAVDADRTRRYASASLFADDLDRILAHRPPIARAMSNRGRIKRLWTRHRRTISCAVVLLSVAFAATVVAVEAKKSRRVEERAVAERIRRESARRSFDLARDDLRVARSGFHKGAAFADRVKERLDRASAEIAAGRRDAPDDAFGPMLLGESAWIRGERAAAEECFLESLRLDPHFSPAHKSLGRLLIECAFIETMQYAVFDRRETGGKAAQLAARARHHLEKSLEGLAGRDADLVRTMAEMASAQIEHRCADVQKLFLQSEEKFRGEPEAGQIAWLAAMCRRNERRLELIDRALADEPRHPLMLLGRAVCLHDLGRFSEALAALDRALEVDANLLCLRVVRVQIMAESGRTLAAVQAAKDLVAQHPDAIDPLWVLAQAAVMNGMFPVARRALDDLLEKCPGYIPALVNRSNIRRIMSNDTKAAWADLERAKDVEPNNSVVREARGFFLLESGDIDRARAELDIAVADRDAGAEAFAARAMIAFDDGHIDRATRLVDEALRRDPTCVPGLLLRASLRERRGDVELADGDYVAAERMSRRAPMAIVMSPRAPDEGRLRHARALSR